MKISTSKGMPAWETLRSVWQSILPSIMVSGLISHSPIRPPIRSTGVEKEEER